MDPPDQWADYLRQRGESRATEATRGSSAGRLESFRGDASLRPGAGFEFTSASFGSRGVFGHPLQGESLRGAGSWLNGQPPLAAASGVLGHRGSVEEIGGTQEFPHAGGGMQSPSGCTTLPRQSSGEVVGVHPMRIEMEPTHREGPREQHNGDRQGQRGGPEGCRSPGSRISTIPTSPSKTPTTRCSSGDDGSPGQAANQSGGGGFVEHWSYAFFHGNFGDQPDSAHFAWTTTSAEGQDTHPDGDSAGNLRAEHGCRGLGRCADDQSQRRRHAQRVLLSGEQVKASPSEEIKSLAGALRRRGSVLGSILVLLSLAHTGLEHGLGNMFGSCEDKMLWDRETKEWTDRHDPPRGAGLHVYCHVFSRDNLQRDWMADLCGRSVALSAEDKVTICTACHSADPTNAEPPTARQVIKEAKRKGLDLAMSMDLSAGWNFANPDERTEALRLLTQHRPALVVLSAGRDDEDNHMEPEAAARHCAAGVWPRLLHRVPEGKC